MSCPFLSEHTAAEPSVTAQVVVPFSSTLQVMVVRSDCGPSTTAVAEADEVNNRANIKNMANAKIRAEGAVRRTRFQENVAAGDTQRAPGQPFGTAST